MWTDLVTPPDLCLPIRHRERLETRAEPLPVPVPVTSGCNDIGPDDALVRYSDNLLSFRR